MQKVKVLLFGSCVSRDALELNGFADMELIEYFARSSIAGVGTAACDREVSLDNVESNFQRRILGYELNKSFADVVVSTDFDVLLVDLIDERFGLLVSEDENTVFTLSNEMLKTDVKSVYEGLEVVLPLSQRYYELWLGGWERLVDILSHHGCLHKLRVSQALWASQDSTGVTFDAMYRKGWIEKNNQFLMRMYERMAQDLSSTQFVQFTKESVVADANHKWGRSPFHYMPQVYMKIIASIKDARENISGTQGISELAEQLKQLRFDDAVEVVQASLGDSVATLPFFPDFYNQVASDNITAIMQEALSGGQVELISPRRQGNMQLVGSVYLVGRNFLFFDDQGVLAVLVQHHKFCRALYYPSLRVLLKLDAIDLPNDCFNALHDFCGGREEQLNSYFCAQKIESAGVMVSYGRPYHYFYDMLPSVLSFKKYLQEGQQVLSINGGSFYPVPRLFGRGEGLDFASAEALSDYLLDNNKYLIVPGYPQMRPADFGRFDELVVADSLAQLAIKDPDLTLKLGSSSAVFWFGICVEKRVWREQVETIRAIIADVLQKHADAVFIFDGLTSAEGEDVSSFRLKNCVGETKLLREITEGLVPISSVVDLVGARAEKKIACAYYVSMFLTSFLTDSMYVARFNGKKGIGYGARSAMHTDHLHPNTHFVPQSWVVDDASKSRNWSEVSYSIKPDLMRAFFAAVWGGNSYELDLKNAVIREAEGVDVQVMETAIQITCDTRKKHALLRLISGGKVGSPQGIGQIPAGKEAVVRFLGRTDRQLSVSAVVAISQNGKTVQNQYLSLGQSLHVPSEPNERGINITWRLKGSGKAIVRAVDLTVLSESEEMKPGSSRNEYEPIDLTDTVGFEKISREIAASYLCKVQEREFYFRFVPHPSNNLLVFFHSALTRTSASKMPAFAGNGAIGVVDANILMISDPSITNDNELSLAWYAGAQDFQCQAAIKELVHNFSKSVGHNRTVFYGGSGGGFASLYYGRELPGSFSVCANPQTDISLYSTASVRDYLDVCFPSASGGDNAQRLHQAGIDYQLHASEQENTVIYLQNAHDKHHLNVHLPQYYKDICLPSVDVGGTWLMPKQYLYLSSSWGKGHTAPPRTFVFDFLKYIFSESFSLDSLSGEIKRIDSAYSSLIDRVSLSVSEKEGVTCRIHPSTVALEAGDASYAFYLLKDGKRVEYLAYQSDPVARFDVGDESAMFQAVGFVRSSSRSSTVKSNKVFKGNEE